MIILQFFYSPFPHHPHSCNFPGDLGNRNGNKSVIAYTGGGQEGISKENCEKRNIRDETKK